MATMNISMPDTMRDFVESQVGERYTSSSEYIRELIRHEQDIAELRAKIMEGGNSPVVGPMDEVIDRLMHKLSGDAR